MKFKRSARFLSVVLPLLLAAGGAAAAEGQPAPKHKITQSASYILIDPLYATIFDAGRPCGMLMVAIGLDIPDARLREQVQHDMPILRDAWLRHLTGFAAAAVRPRQQPDVTAIAAQLQRITNRTLEAKGAQVLLAEVTMRLSR
jgi:flagellar basal body-associated protein FliL